jgi:hypothetical protein
MLKGFADARILVFENLPLLDSIKWMLWVASKRRLGEGVVMDIILEILGAVAGG